MGASEAMGGIPATEFHDGYGFSQPLPPVPQVRCDGAAFELLTGPRAAREEKMDGRMVGW